MFTRAKEIFDDPVTAILLFLILIVVFSSGLMLGGAIKERKALSYCSEQIERIGSGCIDIFEEVYLDGET